MTAPLFDSHCHLDFEHFVDDFDDVVTRAKAAGIVMLATIGSGGDVATAEGAVRIAHANADFMVATVGIHPHDAKAADDAVMVEMERLVQDPIVRAVGEVGLDFHYDHSPREIQRELFRTFIALAKKVKKPITVHTRNAAEETLSILREENARDVGGIIHCFSENPAFAKAALDMGFVSSFSGIVTFKNAIDIRESARVQPLDAILVETDAPFLAPVPFRGKRNEPAYVAKTAAVIAELRGISYEAICEATTANAKRVYACG
ncbi:MAG: TatD family hydrolase [Sandaracinaceae bacterium]|nr:TatD family hydrolase [Sandaracinaceae bacterium]